MYVEWYGQSAFRLATQDKAVFIDPFGDVSGLAERGIQFEYPSIEGVDADLLLVTHEHRDHNGVETIAGSPTVVRSTAGRLESPGSRPANCRLRTGRWRLWWRRRSRARRCRSRVTLRP